MESVEKVVVIGVDGRRSAVADVADAWKCTLFVSSAQCTDALELLIWMLIGLCGLVKLIGFSAKG